MKFLPVVVVFLVSGYFVYQKFKPKPPPPPPPPPVVHVEPAPIISEAEQAKIVRSASDEDPRVRWEAIKLLDKMKAPAAYPVMFEKLERDEDPGLRINIIFLLATRSNPEVLQHIQKATKDLEPNVRIAAIKALEQLSDFTAIPIIMESLRDMHEGVRLQAIQSLNVLQDKRKAHMEEEQRRQEELLRKQQEQEASKK